MTSGVGRSGAVMTMLLVAAMGAACGSQESPLDSASTSPSAAPSAEDEAIDVVERFWAERIRVESSGEYESASFDEILSSSMAEEYSARYASFDEGNFRRVGEPELRDFTATVDGDTAIVTLCVNEDDWEAEADAEVVEPEDQGWYATSFALALDDDAWLVTEATAAPEDASC